MIPIATILNPMARGFLVSQIYAMEQEVTAGGITTRVWQVVLQYIFLTCSLAPFLVAFPLAVDAISWIGYGGLLISSLIAYGASVFQSNERFEGMGEPEKIQKLRYDLHKNKTIGKVLLFLNVYISTLFLLVYLGGLVACGLNGFAVYAYTSISMVLFDRAVMQGWLPSVLNIPYLWLCRLLLINTFFGVGSVLAASLSTVVVGFTVWEYIQTHVRGVRSSSWQYPKATPDHVFKPHTLRLKLDNKEAVITLVRTLKSYGTTVTYDHFRGAHVVTQKILNKAPRVNFANFANLYQGVAFNDDLFALIGAEITAQDKFYLTPREEHLAKLKLPENASNNAIYSNYLKQEMSLVVERLSGAQSRDLPSESWLNTQKQARYVLHYLQQNERKNPDVCARILIEIALKTGSHCNRMYAETFSEIFRRVTQQPDEPLTLQERANLALQRVKDEAFKRFYYKLVPILKKDCSIIGILFADINDFHSFNNFAEIFGSEFYLSNNNGIRRTRGLMDVKDDALMFWTLRKMKCSFNDFYNLDTLVKAVLEPTDHLHIIFREWCGEFYPDAYNEMLLDEDMMPDLDNEDLKLLARMMLLDLNIIELDRAYVPQSSVTREPVAPTAPEHHRPLFQPTGTHKQPQGRPIAEINHASTVQYNGDR